MKTYSEFLSESILNEATDTFATKLGAALVEAESLLARISELASKIDTRKFERTGDIVKLEALLRMCDKPEEIAKNGSLMKQRLEKYISGASEK
ncbi:putative internal head protein [Escherichia phage vB_EcoM_Nami]|jgi:hypothetical protein|uniref:Internal head protein n=1 Tax=Escherichia phage EcNP1 TaxID=2576882 RepID=A0A4V1EYL4_9CAUD|nr:internal head protein [Escherichia phage EcNP1]QCQ57105.1 hypothetical protein EcNP1_gp083 [Escherichia phage EcNP1]QXV73440.1 putative internal head protein [Escherichia phage vB_EcoM_Nami]